MMVVMAILGVVLTSLLVLVEAAHGTHASVSFFELRRRRRAGDAKAEQALHRETLLAQLDTLRRPISALLLVALLFTLVHLCGRQGGIVLTVVVGLLYGRTAHSKRVRSLARKISRRYEDRVLGLIEKHGAKLRVLTGAAASSEKTLPLGSFEELRHVLEASRSTFSEEDTKIAIRALRFRERLVGEVMTAKDDIVTVKQDELLGPLVLDDLHKTGHEFFPVVHGTVDHIIGILDIRSLLALEIKRSTTARAAMVPEVVRCKSSQPLGEALALLSSSRQPLLIVTDDAGVTVGLLSLGDVIEAMTGYAI